MVCIDIINSLNLINKNGIIICDDIIKNLDYSKSDKIYKSVASFETLIELKKEKLIEFQLIYKRVKVRFNCIDENKKYIALIKKI